MTTQTATEYTTEQYMLYHNGFASAQRDCTHVEETHIRTMHASLTAQLANRSAYHPNDVAQKQGRLDAYTYWLNGRPQPSLLRDIRNLAKLRREVEIAVKAADIHYQAGYDTGYYAQYDNERSALHQHYIQVSEAEESAFAALISTYHLDDIDTSRAWHLYRRYA